MDIFNSRIHLWYSIFKRDLPWRNTCDPYFIWLSEIILQQTRIDQGLAYYFKFIDEFPSISSLANASEDQILKLWQGLGYYSRARNLHFSAKFIEQQYYGIFPNKHDKILLLKGIGEYTAAAIASISFNLEYPAIDGNVYRVLSRFFGIAEPIDTPSGKRIFKELATELIKGTDPGMHNQAIMEFGALQCTPQKPDCNNCPLIDHCVAYATNKINVFPIKQNKTKQRNRYFNYFMLLKNDYTWLRRRAEKDIWQNLFEFPMIETSSEINLESLLKLPEVKQLITTNQSVIKNATDWKIHILTHQRIIYRIITVQILQENKMHEELIRVNKQDIFNFAVPKLIEVFLKANFTEAL